ncbi:hypothetical protein BV898_05356 [Hypsibius exemplaris]|uniref:Uncharacterized protein n=1 Tax=Hypsibius exemplaris TaxID=2072580 RepID=A0A1W0WZZ8_HYPEX|nr:hypothetical protein BV898_05356 [Hypsibius exemplaris]
MVKAVSLAEPWLALQLFEALAVSGGTDRHEGLSNRRSAKMRDILLQNGFTATITNLIEVPVWSRELSRPDAEHSSLLCALCQAMSRLRGDETSKSCPYSYSLKDGPMLTEEQIAWISSWPEENNSGCFNRSAEGNSFGGALRQSAGALIRCLTQDGPPHFRDWVEIFNAAVQEKLEPVIRRIMRFQLFNPYVHVEKTEMSSSVIVNVQCIGNWNCRYWQYRQPPRDDSSDEEYHDYASDLAEDWSASSGCVAALSRVENVSSAKCHSRQRIAIPRLRKRGHRQTTTRHSSLFPMGSCFSKS